MKVWGLNAAQIVACVEEAGTVFNGNLMLNYTPTKAGRAFRFTLRVKSSREPGHRRGHPHGGHEGRRLVAACWHAHLAVMRSMFAAGATRLQSGMADYRSAVDLEAKKWKAYERNIGSHFKPLAYGDACDCGRDIENRLIKQANALQRFELDDDELHRDAINEAFDREITRARDLEQAMLQGIEEERRAIEAALQFLSENGDQPIH